MNARISHWDGKHWNVVVDTPKGPVEMTLDELAKRDRITARLLVDGPEGLCPQPMSPGA